MWLALAKKYSTRHRHLRQPETGFIDNLRTDELRAWVQKRLVVDQFWGASHTQPRFRTIPGDWDNAFKLVPGGRWLLVGGKDSSVGYYDLDSEDLERVPLVPPLRELTGVGYQNIGLEVHVDQDASRLEFKLAVNRAGEETNRPVQVLLKCSRLVLQKVLPLALGEGGCRCGKSSCWTVLSFCLLNGLLLFRTAMPSFAILLWSEICWRVQCLRRGVPGSRYISGSSVPRLEFCDRASI